MQVMLNGKQTEIRSGATILELLEQFGIGRERVAVEVNLDIVPRTRHDVHCLSEGDRIEIVRFVGGG